MIRRATPALGLMAGLFVLALVLPFLAGLAALPGADWRGSDWGGLRDATLLSLASTSLATALVAAGGVPLGYLLARARGPGANAIAFLVQLPLALPPLASGVLLLFLLAPAPSLSGWITDHFAGVVIAEAFVAAPFAVIAARSAFAAIDPVLEDVAATLGHHAGSRFRHVALPIAWPAIRAGLLTAWLRGFGEFGATVMVAYHPYGLPVYTYVRFGARGLPAMLPVLLPTLLAAIGVMALAGQWRLPPPARSRPQPVDHGPAASPPHAVPMATPRLRFQLRHRQGDFDLDLAWAPRSRRLAILGASGSGKSLTLRLLAGLEAPASGGLALDGRPVTGGPESRPIGYVPQSPSLLPHLCLRDQLLFPVGAAPDRARHWLDRLGLAGLEHRLPAQLSLGQQQRAAIGRALMRPAQLLLLDEPFSALDAPLRRQLQQELLALQAELPLITVIVTHDPEEARLLADEILVIENGRVRAPGSSAVFDSPRPLP